MNNKIIKHTILVLELTQKDTSPLAGEMKLSFMKRLISVQGNTC